MATIKEDYVSFETAKLLKEKGFDEQTRFAYTESGKADFSSLTRYWNQGSLYACPSQSMAMKWLREVHNIQIELNWDKGNQLYSFQIWKLGKYQPEISSLELWRIYKDDNYPGEWKYEEACEAAIKYCLEENLI